MKKEKSVKQSERKAAVIKWLKSLILPVVLCAIIAAGIAAGTKCTLVRFHNR